MGCFSTEIYKFNWILLKCFTTYKLQIHDPYNDLKKDEVNIIQGALELRSKTVKEVMTPLQNCYMISMNSKLDFKVSAIILKN